MKFPPRAFVLKPEWRHKMEAMVFNSVKSRTGHSRTLRFSDFGFFSALNPVEVLSGFGSDDGRIYPELN